MTRMAEQMANIQGNVQNTSRNELVLDSLASNITEFAYDLESGCSFDAWFSRYADLFEKDASKLDDDAKVRLLLRKLNPAAHERYTSFILPKLSREFSFDETVAKLKTIFGSPVSTFHRRYQCLQTAKDENEDFISYSCKVNRACVDFKLQELKEDQFKCLIFVCGLKSPKDADQRNAGHNAGEGSGGMQKFNQLKERHRTHRQSVCLHLRCCCNSCCSCQFSQRQPP